MICQRVNNFRQCPAAVSLGAFRRDVKRVGNLDIRLSADIAQNNARFLIFWQIERLDKFQSSLRSHAGNVVPNGFATIIHGKIEAVGVRAQCAGRERGVTSLPAVQNVSYFFPFTMNPLKPAFFKRSSIFSALARTAKAPTWTRYRVSPWAGSAGLGVSCLAGT